MNIRQLFEPSRIWLWVAAAIVILLSAIYLFSPAANERLEERQLPEFATVLVAPEDRRLDIHSQGIASARHRVSLSMETGGRVVAVSAAFRSGDWVEAGADLVQLDPEPFQLEIVQNRHQLDSARLHLENARANAKVARRLASTDASDFALHKPQLAEAESRVESARSALKMAERRLQQATLKAPFSGRLEQINLAEGQYLRAGEALGSLYSADEVEVRLPIQDGWLNLLDMPLLANSGKLNIPVRMTGTFGGRKHVWNGTIKRREGGLNANRMTWLIAEVKLKDKEPPLEPGVYVDAAISGRQLEQIVTLPRSALVDDKYVWTLGEEQVLRRRSVEWLYRDEHNVYVTNGLHQGEQVLQRGHSHLIEGTPARALPVTPPRLSEDAVAAQVVTQP